MFHVFAQLISIFLMIGLGILARRLNIIDHRDTGRLARLLMLLFYPALIFSSITTNFSVSTLLDRWTLPVGTFLMMLLGLAIGLVTLRFIPIPADGRRRAFLFQAAINNYAFLPLPLVSVYFGQAGVAKLIFSTLGSELAVWTIGVMALTGHKITVGSLRHLLSAPLIAMAAAGLTILFRDLLANTEMAAGLLRSPYSGNLVAALLTGLDMFGGATIPLAMLVAGSRIAELRTHHLFTRDQVTVTVLRLLLIPGTAILILTMLPLADDIRQILIIVAVMPGAIVSVLLSEIYNADTEFAASSILLTHLACLFTIPFWLWLVF